MILRISTIIISTNANNLARIIERIVEVVAIFRRNSIFIDNYNSLLGVTFSS
jgi:PHP family Zn ribbon phosphoesterase